MVASLFLDACVFVGANARVTYAAASLTLIVAVAIFAATVRQVEYISTAPNLYTVLLMFSALGVMQVAYASIVIESLRHSLPFTNTVHDLAIADAFLTSYFTISALGVKCLGISGDEHHPTRQGRNGVPQAQVASEQRRDAPQAVVV